MPVYPEPGWALSGLEEAALYHDTGQHGFFSLLWLRNGSVAANLAGTGAKVYPKQRSYPLRQLPQIIETLDQSRDICISHAEFSRPNRREVNVLRLNLCFVDLDTHKTKTALKDCPPDTQANLLRWFCQDEGIPEPSLIVFSGRGLQVKWLFERPLPRAALLRWKAVQQYLVARLRSFGADSNAKAANQVLRLVDTVNTRSGEQVRVLWVNDSQGEIRRYSFDHLAEWVLPVDREVIRQKRTAREERRGSPQSLKSGRIGNLRPLSDQQLAWDRLEDLRTLAKLRGWTETGIPHGYRSKYIHWCLNFLLLSGAVHSSQLFYEAQALVREVCPDFPKELRSVLSTLYRKAQAYEAGEKVEFNGRTYPPLYTPRNSTLIDLFDITGAEMRKLKTIITQEEAAERDRKRHRKQVDRATYLETAEQRRVEARLRRARGESLRQIAEALGVTHPAVIAMLRD